MKNFKVLFLALFMFVAACTTVSPGHVGIVVNKLGKDRGVSDIPTAVGFQIYNPLTTDILVYPTSVQRAVWTSNPNEGSANNEEIPFTTKDNMAVHVDVAVSYHLKSDMVPHFYQAFRSDDLAGFTHGFFRDTVRNCFDEIGSSIPVDNVMGDNAKFINDTKTCVDNKLNGIGIVIDNFGIIGVPRPPQQVIAAINAKVQATQIAIQKENEVRQAQADAQKAIAEAEGQSQSVVKKAQGDAEANRLLTSSLNPTLLEWQRLQIQQIQAQRWDGQLPSTVLGGNTPLMLTVPTHQ